MKRLLLLVPMLVVGGCGSEDPAGDDLGNGPDAGTVDAGVDAGATTTADGCAPMFQQDVMPEWRVTVDSQQWALLEDEFLHVVQRTAMGLDPNPYHPAQVEYVVDGTTTEIAGAEIRLKGSSSWLQTIELDPNPKMQFVISFNELSHDARFQGVRKVDLDMPRIDQTFLHQRVAAWWMRTEGLPAPCANNATVTINGELYGLYTNLEHQDKEFLQRVYPGEGDGDLWDSDGTIQTNEDTADPARFQALWSVTDVAQVQQLADLDDSIAEWTAEAMIGDADGYSMGRPNFFLYDHPTKGFIWLAHDLDTAIDWDFMRPDVTPVFATVPAYEARYEPDWRHYRIVMKDPSWVHQYVEALRGARSRFDPDQLQENIALWNEQIVPAVMADPHKPFTFDAHALAIMRMSSFIPARAAYIDQWLDCWKHGGVDADGDGVDMCHDCDDENNAVAPGKPEVCDTYDNDCDGRVDDVDGVSVCQ